MQASASLLSLFVSCANALTRKTITSIKCAVSSLASMKPNLTIITVTGTALVLFAAPMQVLSQEEDWWFDVEVIAFKRNNANTALEEDFSYITHEVSSTKAIDLISLPLYRRANPLLDLQQMLYECSPNSTLYHSNLLPLDSNDSISLSEFDDNTVDVFNKYKIFTPLLSSEERFGLLLDPQNCSNQKQAIARSMLVVRSTNKIPVYLQQPNISITEYAHLLDDNQLTLVDYAKRLFGQRDVSALSHIVWRQPVFFGEENSSFYRVFAGDKLELPEQSISSYETLKQKFVPEIKNIIDQNSETFFAELTQQLNEGIPVNWESRASNKESKLTDPSSLDDVWEIDGKVKVYLKYINRVPYLHIESEFEFHELELNSFGEAKIEQYPFKQRRRVISKQIHYFDHPKMGIIIRLQRYEKPKEEDNEDIY
ncbi:MAG: hypothetical protein ACI9IT_000459 [Glaciecola sp.]|jgi:hypothetical protein